MSWQLRKLMKIIWQNYITDLFGIFSGWAVMIITLSAWLFFKDSSNSSSGGYDAFILSSAIGASCVRSNLFNLSISIYDFRKSATIEKFLYVGVSRTSFYLAVLIFNFLLSNVINIFLILIGMFFESQRETIMNVNWTMFIPGYLMMIVICQFIGLLVGLNFKNKNLLLTFGLFSYFSSVYFLGLGIPYNMLEESKILYWIGYIFLQRPAIMLMNAGWINSPKLMFEINGISHTFGYFNNVIYLLLSVFTIIIFLLILFLYTIYDEIKILYKTKKSKSMSYYKKFKRNIKKINSFDKLEDYLHNNSLIGKDIDREGEKNG